MASKEHIFFYNRLKIAKNQGKYFLINYRKLIKIIKNKKITLKLH